MLTCLQSCMTYTNKDIVRHQLSFTCTVAAVRSFSTADVLTTLATAARSSCECHHTYRAAASKPATGNSHSVHSCKSGWLTCGLHSIDIRDVVVTLCKIVDEGKHPMLSMQQAFWCDSAISTLVNCTAGVAARMSADCMLTHMCTRYVRSVLQEATARANPPEHCLGEETNIHSVGSPARPESGLGNIRPVLQQMLRHLKPSQSTASNASTQDAGTRRA